MAIPTLNVTEGYSTGTILTLSQLSTAINDIEVQFNSYTKTNLEQVALDSWGAGNYTYNNDGAASKTNTLYNKQSATDNDVGDTTLNVLTTWTDVDAADASVVITPELSGDFKAVCTFTYETTSSNAVNNATYYFRLTDGTTHSIPVKVKFVTGVINTVMSIPVTLVYEFSSWSVAAKTVKLQYYQAATTAEVSKIVANGTTTYATYLHVEKI